MPVAEVSHFRELPKRRKQIAIAMFWGVAIVPNEVFLARGFDDLFCGPELMPCWLCFIFLRIIFVNYTGYGCQSLEIERFVKWLCKNTSNIIGSKYYLQKIRK